MYGHHDHHNVSCNARKWSVSEKALQDVEQIDFSPLLKDAASHALVESESMEMLASDESTLHLEEQGKDKDNSAPIWNHGLLIEKIRQVCPLCLDETVFIFIHAHVHVCVCVCTI